MTRTRLYQQCRDVAEMIVVDVEHRPGGLLWWWSLPQKGRHNQRTVLKHWTDLIYTCLFSFGLKAAMLKAVIGDNGVPIGQGKELYTWLLANLYQNDEKKLYKDRLRLRDRIR